MRFRPCIDIHNGRVKQIIGGSLTDRKNRADENFVSELDASYYAQKYKEKELSGGHVIMLNAADSEYYECTKQQALKALYAYPGGLQAGGGITLDNAEEFLDAGASHVIVTSYVFKNGQIYWERLRELSSHIGKKKLVLDLSCRRKDEDYYIVTDRWQKFTKVRMNRDTIAMLQDYCDEFLVHAVDVEGKAAGIEEGLARILADSTDIPVTYAGGVGSYEDLEALRSCGQDKLDVTIGSALDMFGGKLSFDEVIKRTNGNRIE